MWFQSVAPNARDAWYPALTVSCDVSRYPAVTSLTVLSRRISPPVVRTGVEACVRRAAELNLRLKATEDETKVDFIILLTVQTMNYLHSGRHRVAL